MTGGASSDPLTAWLAAPLECSQGPGHGRNVSEPAGQGPGALRRWRGIDRSTREFEAAIDRYLTVYDEAPKPFVWTKTADEILASVARSCHRISDSGH